MATVANATVKVTMDRTGVDQGIATIGSQLKGMGREGAQAVGAVGRSLTMGLTLPLVAAGVGIVKVAADFERSMNRVAALSGATGAAFNKLNTQAKQLGATTQFSASQAADAMGFLAQAGFEAEQIYAAMPATLNLAGAAQLDLGRSADIVSNVLTGFRLPVEQLDRAVDVLTATFTSANTDLNQLGEAFKYVGPVASSAGLAFEDTAAALGLLSNSGIQASAAGTGLRQILITLSKEQEVFGVKTRDAAGNMRPLVDIMAEAEGKTIGLEDAINTFNIRGGPAFLALLGQGSDALRTLTDRLDDSAGSAERIQEVQMQGLVGEITKLKSAAEGLAIAFGESGLLAAMTGIVARVTESIRSFSQLDETTRRNILVAGGLLAALGPLLSIISKIALAIPNLVKAFQVLRLAMLPMFGPVGLVVAGTVALGTLAAVMGGRSRRAMQDLRQATGTASDALASGDKGSLLSALDAVIDKVKGPTRDALVQLKEDLENTGTMDPGPVLEALDAIIDLAEGDTRTALETLRASMDDVEELDVSEVLSALDTVTAQVDGPVRAALLRWRQDLIQTGTVAVEQAQRAAAALVQVELFPDLARPGPIRAIEDLITHVDEAYRQVEADNIREALVAGGQGTRVQQSLLSGNFVDAIGFTNDAIARLQRTADATGNKMTADFADVLRGFAENLQRRSTEAFDAVFNDPGYFTPADSLTDVPDGGAPPPSATEPLKRTLTNVFQDLDDAGSAAVRIARFDDTKEALQESVLTRVNLFNAAIAEVLTDFADVVSEDQLDYLRQRRDALIAEYGAMQEWSLAQFWAFRQAITQAGLRAEEDAGTVGRAVFTAIQDEIDDLVWRLQEGIGGPSEQLDNFRQLQALSASAAEEFYGLARSLLAAERAARGVATSTADLRAGEDAGTAPTLGFRPSSEASRQVDYLQQLLRDAAAPGPVLLKAYRDLQGLAPALAREFSELASQQLESQRVAADLVRTTQDLREEEDALQAVRVDSAAQTSAQRLAGEVGRIVDYLRSGAGTLDQRLEAFRDLQGLSMDAAGEFDDLARGLLALQATISRLAETTRELRQEEDALQAVRSTGPSFQERRQSEQDALVDFLRSGEGSPFEQMDAFRDLQAIAPEAAVEFYDLARALMAAALAASRVVSTTADLRREEDALQAVRSDAVIGSRDPFGGFDFSDGVLPGIFGPPSKDSGDAALKADRTADNIEQAAQEFRETVVRAGITLADGLVNALRSGDAGGVLSSVAGFVGSLVGTVDPVVGLIIGFVGSLLGGLIPAPGDREREAERARGATPRGAPAIEFNLTVLQSLSVQSLTDPASRQAVNGLLNETVERITRVIEQNVIPRVSRLEAAVL